MGQYEFPNPEWSDVSEEGNWMQVKPIVTRCVPLVAMDLLMLSDSDIFEQSK